MRQSFSILVFLAFFTLQIHGVSHDFAQHSDSQHDCFACASQTHNPGQEAETSSHIDCETAAQPTTAFAATLPFISFNPDSSQPRAPPTSFA